MEIKRADVTFEMQRSRTGISTFIFKQRGKSTNTPNSGELQPNIKSGNVTSDFRFKNLLLKYQNEICSFPIHELTLNAFVIG